MKNKLLREIDAFNNVYVEVKEGESLIGFYVKGTRFALEGVEKLLKEYGIIKKENVSEE